MAVVEMLPLLDMSTSSRKLSESAELARPAAYTERLRIFAAQL